MKAIIFDFDGTIADSFVVFIEVFDEIAGRSRRLTAKEIESLGGQSLKEILKYLKIRSWQIPRLVIKGKKALGLRILDIKPFPNMPKTLQQMHQSGYKMYILSTNSSAHISKFLRANKLDPYFVDIYGDIGLRGKSAGLKKLIKAEGLSAGQCIYVGDETRDIEAGRKADIAVLAVGWGFNHPRTLKRLEPDFFAAEPNQILKLLDN